MCAGRCLKCLSLTLSVAWRILKTSELMHHSILLIPEMLVFSFSGQWLWPKRMNALVTQYIRLYHTFHSEINDLFLPYFLTLACLPRFILFFYAIGPYIILSSHSTCHLLRPAAYFWRKYSLCLILYLQSNHGGRNSGHCALRAPMLGCS